jgi:trehalose 6-phosphate phosphatase
LSDKDSGVTHACLSAHVEEPPTRGHESHNSTALTLGLAPPPPPAHLSLSDHAFFLDLDGTLLEYAARPDEVHADPALLSLLRRLSVGCGGALALVSGRTIESLDTVTHPERFIVSGTHGFERRDLSGHVMQHTPPQPGKLEEIRQAMDTLRAAHPELLLEDKGFALALHYRAAPHLAELVDRALNGIPDLSRAGLRVQRGQLVSELVPARVDKGSALVEFMAEPPFRNRVPVYVGDDLTDEPAFEWVNRAGGVSVVVKPRRPSAARAALASVIAVRSWLGGLVPENE